MQIINPSANAVYKGVIQSTMRVASGEGVLKLWRGMSSVVVGAGRSLGESERSLAKGIFSLSQLLRTCTCCVFRNVRGSKALDGW